MAGEKENKLKKTPPNFLHYPLKIYFFFFFIFLLAPLLCHWGQLSLNAQMHYTDAVQMHILGKIGVFCSLGVVGSDTCVWLG